MIGNWPRDKHVLVGEVPTHMGQLGRRNPEPHMASWVGTLALSFRMGFPRWRGRNLGFQGEN